MLRLEESERSDEEAQLDRFLELRGHFREAGCCWACSMGFALIQVSREYGEAQGEQCPCFTPAKDCRARANAARATMPRQGSRAA